MSPHMKLSVLAFVGAAAAIPQYGVGHGHGHRHLTPAAGTGGPAYPTGGWVSGYNSSAPAVPQPQGTGTGSPAQPGTEVTTIVENGHTTTSTITRTTYLTVGSNTASPTDVAAQDVSSKAECGNVVYVTEKNTVTVTVPAGGASAPATSAAPEAPSSAAPQAPSSAPGYEAAQPSVPAEKPSSSAAPVASPSETSYVLASSAEIKPSSAAVSAPAPSEEAVQTSAPAPTEEAVQTSAAPASSVQESSAPAASASSTSSTGGYAGGKRGLAYRWDGAADCKSFEDHNFGFAWNWEADTKGDIGKFAGSFIPTLRVPANEGEWAEKAQAAIDAGSKVVFGYNEPDIASQANMDATTLCTSWKAHMNQFSGKATVVGPAISSSEDEGKGLDYLTKWVAQCPDAKFDDINIHWYGPASAGFDAFKSHYEKAAGAFSGKKVWVTEFGLTGATADESADFLSKAQEYLDGESSCAGYSYYAVGNFEASANLLGSATDLTKTGKVYTGQA